MNFPPNASCISCGCPCDTQGGINMDKSHPGEPICNNCTIGAQKKMQRMHVYVAINGERDYQDQKHGDHKHSPMEWIGIIEGLVARAKNRFTTGGQSADTDMLHEVRKIAATAVACMEQNGVHFRDDEQAKCDVCGDTYEQHQNLEGYDHQFGGIEPIPSKGTTNVILESDLRKSVERTLNCFSAENGSNTPDFILAQYLLDCLGAYDKAVTAREKWYGREPVPVPPDQAPARPDVVGKPFLSSI